MPMAKKASNTDNKGLPQTMIHANSDRLATIIIVNVAALVSMLSFAAAPVFLGVYVDILGFNLSHAGLVVSAETIGLALGSVVSSLFLARPGLNLKTVVIACLVVLASAQIASSIAHDVFPLGLARGVSGFVAGIIYSAGGIYISGLSHPDRPYAIYYGILFVAGPLGLAIVPSLIPVIGLNGIFIAYAVCIFLSILAMLKYPKYRPHTDHQDQPDTRPHGFVPSGGILLLLGAVTINFICNGGIWVYAERIGAGTGISSDNLGLLLSAAMLCGLLGSALVSVIGDKAGRLGPITIAHIALVGSMIWLYAKPQAWGFFGAIAVLNIAITVLTPYILAQLAQADDTGRSVVLGTVAFSMGYGLGPGAISLLLKGNDFTFAFIISAIGFIISLLMICLSFQLSRNRHSEQRKAA